MDSLRITGNAALADDVLREAAGDCTDVYDCSARVEAHYFDHGYLTAKVEPTKSFVQMLTSQFSSLTVEEGPLFTLTALVIVEQPPPADELGDPAQLAPLSAMRVGEPFQRETLRKTNDAILARYAAAGYPHASVSPVSLFDPAAQTIELRLEIDRGAKGP